jgi:hypothetical protein
VSSISVELTPHDVFYLVRVYMALLEMILGILFNCVQLMQFLLESVNTVSSIITFDSPRLITFRFPVAVPGGSPTERRSTVTTRHSLEVPGESNASFSSSTSPPPTEPYTEKTNGNVGGSHPARPTLGVELMDKPMDD